MTVTVYTTTPCIQCDVTLKQFDRKGIEVDVKNVEEHLDDLRTLFGPDESLSAPIVVPPTGAPWYGFRVDRINDYAAELARTAAVA